MLGGGIGIKDVLSLDDRCLYSILRVSDLLLKVTHYRSLIADMKSTFMEVLEERGIITEAEIERQVKALADTHKIKESGISTKELKNILIYYYFSISLLPDEVENYINLVRKRDRFKNLWKVVNTEGVSHKKIIKALKEFCSIPEGKLYINPDEAEGVRVALINHFISNQLPFIGVAKKHITIRDIDELLDRTYGSPKKPGFIGGKAAGMLLAYRILVPRLDERDPELERYITIPESYYFNSGIFSEFIEYNNLHQFRTQKYRSREAIEKDYRHISELFAQASFPPELEEMFAEFLRRIGEVPLILRSSSLLEDNFGHAFAGKYDSVFVTNQGPLKERLKEFIWGLKRVHMSTYGPAPILYRRDHNLLDFDEKMAVLVQRVVGKKYGKYFFPFAAGVAFSRNMYRWSPKIRKEDGIVRLVLGLGTRAVDRIGLDYARLIPLSHPHLRPEVDAGAIMKYSQKMVDVLNLEAGKLESLPFTKVASFLDSELSYLAFSYYADGYMRAPMFKSDQGSFDSACITFDNFLKKTVFVSLMKKVLKRLEQAYGSPVDVEFAWDGGKLYLLQCRTLAAREEPAEVSIPENIKRERILFTNKKVLFNARVLNIDFLVYVDPKEYKQIDSYDRKLQVGRIVSAINRRMENNRYALLGPGRWGSNDINLGVKVGYEDINRAVILGEIAYETEGMTPEVSFGTHFFNDLIEAKIVPVAIFPDDSETIFNEDFFLSAPNELRNIVQGVKEFERVVRVIDIKKATHGLLLHVLQDAQSQRGIGFLDSYLSK